MIAISIGGMLGTGIFVLPGIAATKTGASLWLAYLIAAICILPAAYSKSELATAMPSSGGTYVYIERAFGPLFGTISGIGLWLALVLKCAFALVGIGAYVLVVLGMDSAVITKTVALIFLAAVFLLNIFGAKTLFSEIMQTSISEESIQPPLLTNINLTENIPVSIYEYSGLTPN